MFNGADQGGRHTEARESGRRRQRIRSVAGGYTVRAAALLAFVVTSAMAAPAGVVYSERLVIEQVFGVPGAPGWADGSPEDARFHSPAGLDFDAEGALFVADRDNRAVRKISPAREVTTLTMPPPQPPNPPAEVDLIFDADVGDDIDDVGDLAILHRLADLGRVNILATIGSNLQDYSSAAIEILNRHFGRPELPIGVPISGTSPFLRWAGPFMKTNWPAHLENRADAPDSLHLYREILASRPDGSVTILVLGQLRNIYSLWNSPPDAFSPLTGRELLERKVKEIVVAAGFFPASTNIYPEYNIFTDIQAAFVLNEIKTVPVVHAGIELATPGGGVGTVFFGANIGDRPSDDIVRRIFEHVYETQSQHIYGVGAGRAQRPAWGSMALLYAVSGLAEGGTNLFTYSPRGTNYIRPSDWHNVFTEDPAGNQRYLLKAQPDSFYSELLDHLLMTSGLDQQPTDGPIATARLGNVTDVATTADGALAFSETYGYRGGIRVVRDGFVGPPETVESTAQIPGALHVVSNAEGALFASYGGLWPRTLWRASFISGNWERIGGANGFADGDCFQAAFAEPLGLDADPAGNVFIADAGNHAIRKATPDGLISTIAGHPARPGWRDGPADQARFLAPLDLASVPGGSIYVLHAAVRNTTDTHTAPIALRRISSNGNVTSILLPEAVAALPAAEFRFSSVAVDRNGRVALAATEDHIILVGRIEPILSHRTSGASISLSWTDPLDAFVLEKTSSLSAPVQWISVLPAIDGDTRSVNLPTDQKTGFFRLRHRE